MKYVLWKWATVQHLKVNVFEVLVDLLYKIPQDCARNANPYWPSGQKKI